MNIAAEVVKQLLQLHSLPDNLARLIYYSILKYHFDQGYTEEAVITKYVQLFSSLICHIPRQGGPLRARLRDYHRIHETDIWKMRNSIYWPPKEINKLAAKDYAEAVNVLYGTPYSNTLEYMFDFDIVKATRFEHTHVLGSTGSGKTQLLQRLIHADIETGASVIVMAPKGNLIPNLTALDLDPNRIILINAENPIALNIFDLKGDTNNVVSLLSYIFSSILDATTTSKQTALLNYSIRLLLAHPGSTILSLRALMKAQTLPLEYEPTLEKLSTSAREFFTTQFNEKKVYGETKEQMMWRLDLLLENTIIETMFAQPRNKLNMLKAMNSGKVVLIDTSEKVLGSGSSFLGRFIISLVTLAAQQRDTRAQLLPCFFYIDEASLYLGQNMESILERARESRVGLTLAHQQLAQLTPQLQASIITNTSTKFVGGCSAHDAQILSQELQIEKEKLQHQNAMHFHVKSKGAIPIGVPIVVEAGYLEQQPKRGIEAMRRLIAENKARYGVDPRRTEPPASTVPSKKVQVPKPPQDDSFVDI